MKIAVIFDSPHPEWEDAAFKREIEEKVEEAEYDVARALLAGGHDVLMIGIGDDVAPLLAKLAEFQPRLVFNGCEGFRKNARHEYAIAALLDMYGYRYTGSSPTALLVARNKSLTKKILAYHGIRVPAFAEFHEGDGLVRPSELRFPLSLKQRVEFIHAKYHQAAIVEELVEGREVYVGLIGNDKLEVLPLTEMTFGEPETTEHRIATYKAKWDEDYRKKKKIKNVFAKGVSEELTRRIGEICSTAFHALWLQDYGRVDVRLAHDDEVYVLEVNPNPFIADEHELAEAAKKSGLKYNAFIQRIVDEALAR